MDFVICFVGELAVLAFGAIVVESQIVTFSRTLWAVGCNHFFYSLAALYLLFGYFRDLVEVMALFFLLPYSV